MKECSVRDCCTPLRKVLATGASIIVVKGNVLL